MKSKPDPSEIAADAIGERLGSEPPEEVRERGQLSMEDAAWRFAKSSGTGANIPEKTAESVGERIGTAYADPANVTAGSWRAGTTRGTGTQFRSERRGMAQPAGAASQMAEFVSHRLDEQPILTVMASFILGYMAALLLHGRG